MFVLVVFLLIWASIKNRAKEESKLSVLEHPSTFKKPDIETVNSSPDKKEDDDTAIQFESERFNKKGD